MYGVGSNSVRSRSSSQLCHSYFIYFSFFFFVLFSLSTRQSNAMPKMGKHDINNSLERPGLNKDVKVVVVGPAKSGKTALVQRFVNDTFSSVSVLHHKTISTIFFSFPNHNAHAHRASRMCDDTLIQY